MSEEIKKQAVYVHRIGLRNHLQERTVTGGFSAALRKPKVCVFVCVCVECNRVSGHYDLQSFGLRPEGERGEGTQSTARAANRPHDQHDRAEP